MSSQTPDLPTAKSFNWRVVLLWLVPLLLVVRFIVWRMEYNEIYLLGFPGLIWFAYFIVWCALGFVVYKWAKRPLLQVMGMALTVVLGWQLAWLDNTLVNREFASLCRLQGGTHVYKQVEIGPEYFTADGKFSFVDRRGHVEKQNFPPQYSFIEEGVNTRYPSRYSRLYRSHLEIRDLKTQEILAEQSQFSGQGGGPPIPLAETNHIKGAPCPRSMGKSVNNFFAQVFVRESE